MTKCEFKPDVVSSYNLTMAMVEGQEKGSNPVELFSVTAQCLVVLHFTGSVDLFSIIIAHCSVVSHFTGSVRLFSSIIAHCVVVSLFTGSVRLFSVIAHCVVVRLFSGSVKLFSIIAHCTVVSLFTGSVKLFSIVAHCIVLLFAQSVKLLTMTAEYIVVLLFTGSVKRFTVTAQYIVVLLFAGSVDFAENKDGRWDISIQAVQCPVGDNKLQYAFQGSNPWYLKLQVSNYRYTNMCFTLFFVVGLCRLLFPCPTLQKSKLQMKNMSY